MHDLSSSRRSYGYEYQDRQSAQAFGTHFGNVDYGARKRNRMEVMFSGLEVVLDESLAGNVILALLVDFAPDVGARVLSRSRIPCGVFGFRSVATTRPSGSVTMLPSGILQSREYRTPSCPIVHPGAKAVKPQR